MLAYFGTARHVIGLRFGSRFLYPGCSGSCFPKGVQALKLTARANGHDVLALEAGEAVNHQQKTCRVAVPFRASVQIWPDTHWLFGVWLSSQRWTTCEMRHRRCWYTNRLGAAHLLRCLIQHQ